MLPEPACGQQIVARLKRTAIGNGQFSKSVVWPTVGLALPGRKDTGAVLSLCISRMKLLLLPFFGLPSLELILCRPRLMSRALDARKPHQHDMFAEQVAGKN